MLTGVSLSVTSRAAEDDDEFEARLAALKKAKGETPYGAGYLPNVPPVFGGACLPRISPSSSLQLPRARCYGRCPTVCFFPGAPLQARARRRPRQRRRRRRRRRPQSASSTTSLARAWCLRLVGAAGPLAAHTLPDPSCCLASGRPQVSRFFKAVSAASTACWDVAAMRNKPAAPTKGPALVFPACVRRSPAPRRPGGQRCARHHAHLAAAVHRGCVWGAAGALPAQRWRQHAWGGSGSCHSRAAGSLQPASLGGALTAPQPPTPPTPRRPVLPRSCRPRPVCEVPLHRPPHLFHHHRALAE